MLKLLNPFSQWMINRRWQIFKVPRFLPIFRGIPVNGSVCVGW